MTKQEILAVISEMEKQLEVLKSALVENVNETPVVEETPVVNTEVEEKEMLPDPPAEVIIDLPEEEPKKEVKKAEVDEEAMIGCQILNKIIDLKGMFYTGQCRALRLQKLWRDNSDKVNPKTGKNFTELWVSPYEAEVQALDFNLKILGKVKVQLAWLHNWDIYLRNEGLYKKIKSDDPSKNGMPKVVNIDLG